MASKKYNAWLVTWEYERQDYFDNLNRPRVVAVLKGTWSAETITRILPVLYNSERRLLFDEKLLCSRNSTFELKVIGEDGRYRCGGHPWLKARLVKDLYVEYHGDETYHQTLHWTEFAGARILIQ